MAPEFTNDDGFITWARRSKEVIYRVPRALRWFVLTAGIASSREQEAPAGKRVMTLDGL